MYNSFQSLAKFLENAKPTKYCVSARSQKFFSLKTSWQTARRMNLLATHFNGNEVENMTGEVKIR